VWCAPPPRRGPARLCATRVAARVDAREVSRSACNGTLGVGAPAERSGRSTPVATPLAVAVHLPAQRRCRARSPSRHRRERLIPGERLLDRLSPLHAQPYSRHQPFVFAPSAGHSDRLVATTGGPRPGSGCGRCFKCGTTSGRQESAGTRRGRSCRRLDEAISPGDRRPGQLVPAWNAGRRPPGTGR
jgi:hypothetical protein